MALMLAQRVRGGGLFAWVVRRWTRSKYDHCEILLIDGDDKTFMSATVREGVREADAPKKGEYEYTLIEGWRTRDQVLEVFERIEGQRYDLLALVGSNVIAGHVHWTDSATCSEACAELLGLPEAEASTPTSVGLWVEALNAAYRAGLAEV